MIAHNRIKCPECQHEFAPYQLTIGSGLVPDWMQAIEQLTRKVREINKGKGVPECEWLLTRAHGQLASILEAALA